MGKSVHCEARAEGHAMQQAISRRPVTEAARIRSQASPSENYCLQIGNGTGFSPSTWVFSCKYHSTNVPYLSSSTRFSYQDERAKAGNLPKRNALSSEIRED
jgi:hypothetical protein